MIRRSFLKQLAALPFLATAAPAASASNTTKLKILMESAWGSDDATKAAEVLSKIVAKKIPIYACGACSRARGITETDLTEYGAKLGNPKIFVSLIEWADRIITE